MKVCPVCGTEYGDDAAFCSRDRSPLRPAATGGGEASHDLVGHMVGERYHVERRLGEGGMGEVYLARHVLMGRPCALKVMNRALSKDPDAVSRFNREATNASRISHPNVCAIYDFGLTAEGLVYLAMEYVEGRTLSAVVEESGPMPVRRAAGLLGQCAAGLHAAHELGIVHRDLKPDNVMVVSSRDRETAKLVDFGIAKAVEGDAGSRQRVTKTGFVVGTPEYMSPEQLSGDPLDGRCDQYALALVFYRLITGQLPFEGGSMQETLVKRLTDPPRPLAAAHPNATFPAGLQAVMDRALARHPPERYATVLEFSEAVHAVVAGDAVATRKLSAVGAATASIPSTRQSPAVAGGSGSRRGARTAIAAGTLVLLAGGAWGVMQLTGSKAPSAAPPGSAPDTGHLTSPAPAQGADSTRGLQAGADTARPPAEAEHLTRRVASAPPPGPTPAPVPTALLPAPPTATDAVETDTSELDLNALESPALRPLEIRRAQRLLRAIRLPPHRRAAAAAFLGTVALDAGKRDTALALFRMAYRLDPKPNYLRAIRQFGDTIQP